MKYYFPDLDNLGNSTEINYWICCYLTVLFLRKWTYYTFQDFTDFPNLPSNVVLLNNWLASVSFFENCLKDVLANDELLVTLGYKDVIENKLNEIKDFPTTLKEKIIDKIGHVKLKAPLSEEKIQEFQNQSNDIISKAFKSYNEIFIELDDNEKDDELKLAITGGQTLMSKSAFTDNDIHHINFDSILASQISKRSIKYLIPYSFSISRTRRYLLNKNNILIGIDKLINNNPDIIIVAVNASYNLQEILKKYNSTTKHIPSSDYRIKDILYVLNKSDLPSIEHKDILAKEITDSQLKLINEELKIYASIIDINTSQNEKAKEKWDSNKFKNNLDYQVQVTIAFSAIIYWKKERDIVQIEIASEFKELGIQNTIDEIETFKKISEYVNR